MVEALAKLLTIAISAVILCVLVVVAVHSVAGSMQYEAPDTAWFKMPFWWIYQAPKEDICSGKDLDSATPTKDWILELPTRHEGDNWVLVCGKDSPKLIDYLKASKHVNWLIDVQAHETWGLDELADQLNAMLREKHFGLTTRSQKVAVYLRKKAPEWLFAADSSSLVKMRLFESLYLENAFDFWPDFVVSKLSPSEDLELDERGAKELHRRKRRIVYEWNEDKQETPVIPFDGVMTTRPTAAWQKFSSSH